MISLLSSRDKYSLFHLDSICPCVAVVYGGGNVFFFAIIGEKGRLLLHALYLCCSLFCVMWNNLQRLQRSISFVRNYTAGLLPAPSEPVFLFQWRQILQHGKKGFSWFNGEDVTNKTLVWPQPLATFLVEFWIKPWHQWPKSDLSVMLLFGT